MGTVLISDVCCKYWEGEGEGLLWLTFTRVVTWWQVAELYSKWVDLKAADFTHYGGGKRLAKGK